MPNGGVATLVLERLTCDVTDDPLASDEPVLTINGEEVWKASGVDDGDTREVGVRHSFVDSAIVELFDEEIGVSDQLGSRVIGADEAGLGSRQAFFRGSPRARYTLVYSVE